MIIANIVDINTKGESRIVLLLVRLVIHVVRRTTSELYADPVRDPNMNQVMIQVGKGQIRPKENVHTDAVYMKFAEMTVIMMTIQWGT